MTLGSKTNANTFLHLFILDRTVIWNATWESTSSIILYTADGAGTFEVPAGGSIKRTGGSGSAIEGSIAMNSSDNMTVKVTGGYVESNNGTAMYLGASNNTVIVTGGTVKSSAGVDFPVYLSNASGDGVCVFLDGALTYTSPPAYGNIISVSTLSAPASYVGASTGLTILHGGATAVWKSAGGSPVVSISTPDEIKSIELGTSSASGAQSVVISDSDFLSTSGGISPGSLNDKLKKAIDAAGSGGAVIVSGSKMNADTRLLLDILDRTVIWNAAWESTSSIMLTTQSGAGTFDVPSGGSIKRTSGSGPAIEGSLGLNNSNNMTIKVTGGHVESSSGTAIDLYTLNNTVVVTGGTVKSSAGIDFPVYLRGENGVCVFLSGALTYTYAPVFGSIVSMSALTGVPGASTGLTVLCGGGDFIWSASGDSVDFLIPNPPRDIAWGQFRPIVTLDQMGGAGGTASVEAETGQPMPPITPPTRTGYTFTGYWDAATGGAQYYTAAGASAGNWDKTGNATLYARWTLTPYTVTLDKTGGSGGTAAVTANYGVAMPKIDPPARGGYTFAGYWDAATGGAQYYKTNGYSERNWDKTGNTTLYAQWRGILTYTPNPAFDIPAGQVGAAVIPIDVSGGISGGSGDYRFTRNGISNPALDWIQVSEDGEITSSTGARPAAMHGEGTLKISVYDRITFEYLIFTVNAGATTDPNVTFTAAQTGGSYNTADSTGIVITFSQPVAGLTAGDITVSGGTGVVATGALSGYGTTWTLELTSVTSQGTVTVGIANFGAFNVTTASWSPAVYKDNTANGVEVTHTGGAPVTGTMSYAFYNVNPYTHTGTGAVEWYADAEGNIPRAIPDGVYVSFGGTFPPNQTLTITTSSGIYTNPGVYYFRVTLDGASAGVSNMATLTVKNYATSPLGFAMAPLYYENNHSVPPGACGAAYKSAMPLSLSSNGLMVSGGVPLYTFSIAGPDWLEISPIEEPTPGYYVSYITGTRPLTPQAATTATLKVTDMEGNTDTVTINIGAVTASGVSDTAPLAPGGFTAMAGDGQVELSWIAPYDGGSPITGYEYRIGAGPWTGTGSTAAACTVTGLTNGATYIFEVRAVNSVGNGESSVPQTATPKAGLTFMAEQTGGINNTRDSAAINLTFNKAVAGLTIGDITIINGTGEAVKGASLTGAGATYTITLDSVGKQGDVTVRADDFGGFMLTVNEVYPVAVYKDTTPPTGAITIKGYDFTTFLNTSTFGFFYRNIVNVTIAGSDDSGIKSVRYLRTDVVYDSVVDMIGVSWTPYPAGGFSVTSGKSYIYAEITDNNDFVTVIRSGGVVIYTDSAQDTANISFAKGSGENKDATVTLNGNMIAIIMNGADTLDYFDYYAYSDGTVTFFESYLETLSVGSYTLTVYYNPLGEVFDTGDAPATTTIGLTVVPAGVSTYAVTVAGGTGGGSYAAGATVAITADAAPAGQVFNGWTTISAGVTFANASSATTTFTMPANAVSVTANWTSTGGGSGGGGGGGGGSGSGGDGGDGGDEATTYTVEFETNGGSVVSNQSITSGDKAAKPADPAKDGYDFAGWYEDMALTAEYDFNKDVTSDITVYAKWTSSGGVAIPEKWVNPFEDVFESNWFYNDVEYVYINGLMLGTAPTLFSPYMTTNRAMIVTILYRLEGEPGVAGLDNPFNDVPAELWYTDAVIWAASKGIIGGYGNGLFGANDDVTRQDLAVILARYAGFAGLTLPVLHEYAGFLDDTDIADYAKDAVEAFFKAGIINGKPGNIFDPKGDATRAEVAAMLHRFLEAAEE